MKTVFLLRDSQQISRLSQCFICLWAAAESDAMLSVECIYNYSARRKQFNNPYHQIFYDLDVSTGDCESAEEATS
jgi:hypothetical protein